MKMALTDGMVRIIEADAIQKTIIKSWNQMRWIRGQQMYEGIASAELLNKLSTLVHLPPSIEAERIRMNTVQEAVDQERTREHPEPLYKYPVTKNLYEHQVRAANMALMTFGFIETQKKEGPMHLKIRDASIMRELTDAQSQRKKEGLDSEDNREAKGRAEDRPET